MRGTLTALVAITCISVNARDAQAGWPFPGEVSTAEGYNRLYCTEYDTSGPAGLAALVADRGQAMQELWTTDDVAQVQVLAWDSSVAGALYLMAYGLEGVVYLPVYDPGPWTPVSRGWLPDYGSALIDLDALLTSHGLDPASTLFSFTLGANDQRILDAQDTQRLAGLEPGEFLLGYNDGGLTASDRDANEPLILGLKPVEDRIDWCPEGYNLIVGTDGDDELVGTNGPDCIFGLGGNDTIKGKQGDDRIFGGRGDDHLQGNRGNDFLDGGSCHDLVRGGKGDDVLYGGPGDDELRGWQGTDALFGGDGNDILRGGPGVDLLVGGAGDDELRGGKDPDELHGGDGDDYLYGGQGGDIVSGGAGNDVIHGGQGGDILFGGPGNDEMHGQAGPDYLNGGTGNDEVHGGADDDYLDGGEGTDDLRGKKGVDVCVNGEIIHKSCEGTEAAAEAEVAATSVIYGEQGLTVGGAAVPAARSDSATALTFEAADVDGGFYSLGIGGYVAVSWGSAVVNGTGPDVRVWEKTYCCGAYPVESADVYALDPATNTWVLLGQVQTAPGTASNTPYDFDLGDLAFTWAIKVVDTTDASLHTDAGDGFDVNGIYGLNQLH